MDETKVLYLAGDWKGEGNDQPQTLTWIEPDAEHRFYSEDGEWEKMDVGGGSVIHSITYRGAGPRHDHSGYFENKPSEAKAGDTVDVTFDSQGFAISPIFGITDASVQSISGTSQLEQQKSFSFNGSTLTYSFTMPDHDVAVWVWCPETYTHAQVT